ncbi:hypothetical protein C4J99_4840 [Pseudomonas synxantha]|nr:hypothetical protein C4J99_4840 [Pseudomonas synxantha]
MSLRLYRRTVLKAVLIRPGLRPVVPGWRQRDAYSREEDTGSQLDVLPHCYDGGVTAVTDAIQQRERSITAQAITCGSWLACDGISWLTHRVACIAGKPAPTLTESFLR